MYRRVRLSVCLHENKCPSPRLEIVSGPAEAQRNKSPLRGFHIGIGGSPERDISSLRAFGPGGGQVWGVVQSPARALLVDF